jgi:hypothetical protein
VRHVRLEGKFVEGREGKGLAIVWIFLNEANGKGHGKRLKYSQNQVPH